MVSPKLVSKRGADRSLRGDALDIAECQLGQGSLLRPHYPLRLSTSTKRSPESASTTTAAHGGAIRASRAFRQDPTRARLRAHGSPDDDAHSGAIRIPDGGGFLQPYSCADGERYHRLLSRGQPLRGHTGVSTAVPCMSAMPSAKIRRERDCEPTAARTTRPTAVPSASPTVVASFIRTAVPMERGVDS